MPKRTHSRTRVNKHKMKKLKRQLRQMQEEINKIQSSESSSAADSTYSSDSSDESSTQGVNKGTIPEPEQDFSVLGSKPNDSDMIGKPFHEEIVMRWSAYLQKGLDKEQREVLTAKYKLPANCKMLVPPQINNEIQPCLPKSASEHDRFMIALQQQLAHGLTAVGTVIETMIPVQDHAENIKTLADACQLFTNVHYSISAHRKYKIIPHLNQDCRKVAKTMDIGEFLFSTNFADAVKNEQAVKKVSSEFKKKPWGPPNLPRPSGAQHTRHLNYQRSQYKGRMKDKRGEERRPSTSTRYKKYQREPKKYYHRK